MATKPVISDPCSAKALATHPALDGRTDDQGLAGVEGTHCGGGDGLRGVSFLGNGVRGRGDLFGVIGDGFQSGCGIFGTSVTGEGVHGETRSRSAPAVTGIARYSKRNPDEDDRRAPSPGVWGASTFGIGVHGETRSSFYAAVEGIQLNQDSISPGVYGEHRGAGPAGFFRSSFGEGIHGETDSASLAAVAGLSLFTPPDNRSGEKFAAPGLWGSSRVGHGVYAESSSPHFAAVAGIQRNRTTVNAGPAIYGEHQGDGPAGYFKGYVAVTEDIHLVNEDCAEEFDVADPGAAEPGSVMVLDDCGALSLSSRPYDRRVAGIVSGGGVFKPAIILGKRSRRDARRAPLALIGKAYCKVDARDEPIAIGDLLTTSATPGHAMKAADPQRAFGAVIGKALESLTGGTGLIPVLVALQ